MSGDSPRAKIQFRENFLAFAPLSRPPTVRGSEFPVGGGEGASEGPEPALRDVTGEGQPQAGRGLCLAKAGSLSASSSNWEGLSLSFYLSASVWTTERLAHTCA